MDTCLYSEPLLTEYYEGEEIMQSEIVRPCSTHKRVEKWIVILVGNPEAKRPVETLGHRVEDNIKTDLNK
jgi:hypothetical protein